MVGSILAMVLLALTTIVLGAWDIAANPTKNKQAALVRKCFMC